jgi:hypothetical protein
MTDLSDEEEWLIWISGTLLGVHRTMGGWDASG